MAKQVLEEMVLKWTLNDIMNENLFQDKVTDIPERFISVCEYLRSFMWPSVEELRAELQQSLELVSQAPFAPVKFLKEIKASKGAMNTYKMLLDREKDTEKREKSLLLDREKDTEKREKSWKIKPKDILIISRRVPEYVEDFLDDYLLALVHRTDCEVTDKDRKYFQDTEMDSLMVNICIRDKLSFTSEEYNRKNKIFAIYLGNMISSLRIWNALHSTVEHILLPKAICPYTEDHNEASTEEKEDGIEKLRNKHFMSHKLNESQASAVFQAVNSIENKVTFSSINLIQGPPGTGKTSMLISLLSILVHKGTKVLMCAPTNVAISEVAMRFLNLVRNPSECCPTTRNFHCVIKLSDLILVGNEERFTREGPLGDIFLTYRVERLLECFQPVTGWRQKVTSLLDFLESAVSQYEVFKETQEQTGWIDFAQFIRKRLKNLAPAFCECASTLLTDLPGNLLWKSDLEHLVGVVESFVKIIEEKVLNERVFRECFCKNIDDLGESSKCTSILNEDVISNKKLLKEALCLRRNECIQLLRQQLHSGRGISRRYGREELEELCLSHAIIVFSTVSSSGKMCMSLAAPFDCLIIDEAAQLKEAESTIALQIEGPRHAFLIGDPNQLPATVISKMSKKAGYERSLFERLKILGQHVHLLNIQYRMHPLISQFPNREFYENRIINGPNVQTETYGNAYVESEMKYGKYAFINVADGTEEKDDFNRSKRNLVEAAVVLHMLSKLYKVCECRKGMKFSVGVISPYSAQVLHLENKLMKQDEWKDTLDIEVKTVDGFQGGEKDIIIISTVCTKNIGFVSDHRRTNVALTRARFFVWIVGNGSMLRRSNSVWKKITMDAIARKCFLNPSEENGMVKVIRKTKGELDQLQDLLDKDSVLFNNTIWKVTFSDAFKKSFTKIKGLPARQQIINTILNLANGWRFTRKSHGPSDENIINEYATSGLYLVWTIDVDRGEDTIQVLRIWNVLNLAEVPNFRQRLQNVFATYTLQYIERCKAKLLDRDMKPVPKQWKYDPGFVWNRPLKQSEIPEPLCSEAFEKEATTLEHARVEESLLLMKFYCLSSGIANQLLTSKDGSEIDVPFEVNEEESRIIKFSRSLFVLGRSGTGKTTVLTARLLRKEQQFNIASRGPSWVKRNEFQEVETTTGRQGLQKEFKNEGSLRQMFVTVSSKLCSAIRNHIARMGSFVEGKDHAPCIAMHDSCDSLMEFQHIPDSFIQISDKYFPMIITFQKFLIMLDGSVKYSFFKNRCTAEQEGCELQKEECCWSDKTCKDPTKSVSGSNDFDGGDEESEINDEHLFFSGTKGSMYERSLAFMEIMRRNEVTYERFDSHYWPHFNAELIRGLDSSVVFTEIMSHIKGSIKSISSSDFRVSRDDYIAMAESRVSTLNGKQREAIYDLFLQYENYKQKNGNFDIADVVNHLHRQLRSNGYLGEKINFIYVDEVQDLPMAQIALFKYACSNFSEGFVFAGDTAQTIARGVNFRFEDIRNLFYKEFLEADDSDRSKTKVMPDLFHLSQNFRTHTGITRLAQSVVEVLYHFFPFSIDKLSPETSRLYGEPPIFLDTKEGERLITTIFGHRGNSSIGKYEFGAEQAILVRDDNQKVEVLGQVGKQCLVLTILECKGLEFQDVLLYNFFSSSPMRTKWRVLYDFMDQKGHNNSEQKQYPKFNSSKHDLLCSELKHLYVAITRSKQRLWIYDENRQYAEPILDYWKETGIIEFRCLDISMVESMSVASSCEDWKHRGIQMFNEKNYDMAILCFERAGDVNMAKWAKAASLRQAGERHLNTNKEAARHSLVTAAEIFLSIEKPDLAAHCFIVIGDYRQAGRIYEDKCSETRLQDAGDCFVKAKCWYNAAYAYARANCVVKCLNVCSKGKLFEIGLEYIEAFEKENCNSNCGRCQNCERVEIENDYLKKCATYYHEKKDPKTMMKFVKAFPKMDSIRSFLLRKDYLDELIGIEESSRNFIQAAEVAEMKGNLLLEADMLEKAGEYERAVKSILLHVRLNSMWRQGNRGWPLQKFPEKNQLLEKVKHIVEKNLHHVPQSVKAFECEASILSDEFDNLCELTEEMILAQRTENINLEVLSLRKVLDVCLHSDVKIFQHTRGKNLFRSDDISKILQENRVSSTTLVFLWNAWKEKMLLLVDSLSKLEKRREREQDKAYIEFAFEYFGIRMNRNERFCTVFNSEALWLKHERVELLQRQGSSVQISVHNFSMHARKFLFINIFFTGQEVLKKLEEIYLSCTDQYSLLTVQGALILQMYEVLEAVKAIGQVTGTGQDKSLYEIRNLEEQFFNIFFPPRYFENREEFLSLRKEPTSRKILEDATVSIINKIDKGITLGQIGKLQLLLPFLPSNLVTACGEKIIKSLPGNYDWNNKLLWLPFTEISVGNKRLHFVESFVRALMNTFSSWKPGKQFDYVSPHIFLSLLEKLFFLSSYCGLPSESLFLPRSFFLEFMTGEQGNFFCTWLLQSQCVPKCEKRLENFYYPLYHMIYQLLVTSKLETLRWIDDSKMDRTYFSELALRLIIMFCLVGLNSTLLFQEATRLLSIIFKDKQVTGDLPYEFRGKIFQMLQHRPDKKKFFIHFSQAMTGINNPLVKIDLEAHSELVGSWENVITLRQENILRKETILETVFQERDMFVLINKEGDVKDKELLKRAEKNMFPSNSNSLISKVEHVPESVKAEENVADNAREKPENREVSCTFILDPSKIHQQQKGDSREVEAAARNEDTQFSLVDQAEPSHKWKVNGLYIPWFVQWRMKRWLSCARRTLEEQLSMTDKYTQEARRYFQRNKNSFYTETFISKACPLKAEIDEFLDLIETTIPKVKQGKVCSDDKESDVLDDMHDILEELWQLSQQLHPRHIKHEECDIEWLENDVIPNTSTKLQESRNRLKYVLEGDTQIVVEGSEEPPIKGKQNKKNKSKRNKKGGKRKK